MVTVAVGPDNAVAVTKAVDGMEAITLLGTLLGTADQEMMIPFEEATV
jgi:hypothetical protein